jgi:hypothetical protein
MTPSPDCAFVLSVERGKLEPQAILLVDSLRRFGGAYANCPVYAVSPRPSRQMSAACREALSAMGVLLIVEPLAASEEAYGTVARLAACAWAERSLACEILVSLDDDLFFANEPDFHLVGADFFARPVDVKGMCTSGAGDPFDSYWRRIADACGVIYDDIPWLETTVDQVRVKASYNGGMIAVRRERGLFQEAERMFRVLRANDLAPRAGGAEEVFASTGFVGSEATRWWGSAQAVLSLAVTHNKAAVSIAPPSYNIPVHAADSWERYGADFSLNNAVLVHYHWMLGRQYVKKDIVLKGGADLPRPVLEWLKSKTPLDDAGF